MAYTTKHPSNHSANHTDFTVCSRHATGLCIPLSTRDVSCRDVSLTPLSPRRTRAVSVTPGAPSRPTAADCHTHTWVSRLISMECETRAMLTRDSRPKCFQCLFLCTDFFFWFKHILFKRKGLGIKRDVASPNTKTHIHTFLVQIRVITVYQLRLYMHEQNQIFCNF
jgi:hypothetical protein